MTVPRMRIRECRLAAGLTMRELAERLGVTAAAVSSWERGKTYPSASLLPKLLQALGCTFEALFPALDPGEEDGFGYPDINKEERE